MSGNPWVELTPRNLSPGDEVFAGGSWRVVTRVEKRPRRDLGYRTEGTSYLLHLEGGVPPLRRSPSERTLARRQDASARPDGPPGGPHPTTPGTGRPAADVALTDAPDDPNPPHPSPAWCRVCRQRGYASAHCAAAAART